MSKYYTKLAWLGMILMTMDLFMLGETGIKLSAEMLGTEEVFKLVDLGMEGIIITIRYIKIAAIICTLVIAFSTSTVNNIWYAPMAGAGAICIICILCLILMKNRVIEASGLGEAMNLLSIECKVTGIVWGIALTSIVELICGIIPFIKKA